MNGIDILRWLAARLAACAAYLGHDPWLLPAKAVRPFVSGNKNDAHDARAIWTAAQMPGIKTVAVKSEEQQAILALHRIRQQLVKFRTAQINGLRGLLTEYGEVMPKGRAGMARAIAPALERVPSRGLQGQAATQTLVHFYAAVNTCHLPITVLVAVFVQLGTHKSFGEAVAP